MKALRFLATAVALAAVVRVAPAAAQVTDSIKKDNNTAEAQTAPRGPDVSAEQRHHFDGVVATVDGNKITINAKSDLPEQPGGGTTLPYSLKDTDHKFQVGDHVTGELVVKENRSYVENVQPAGDNPDSKKEDSPKNPR